MDESGAIGPGILELRYFEGALAQIYLPFFDLFGVIVLKFRLYANIVGVLGLAILVGAERGAADQEY